MNVLDIPLSITEQMDREVLYWDPGVSIDPSMVKFPDVLGVLATELDCFIAREYAGVVKGMEVVRPIRSYSYIEVNQKALQVNCTNVEVIGKLSEGRGGAIVDSWTVPSE